MHDPASRTRKRRLAYGIVSGVLAGAVALAILVNDEADDVVTGDAAYAGRAPQGQAPQGPPRPGVVARDGALPLPGAAATGRSPQGAPFAGGGVAPAVVGAPPSADGGTPAEAAPAGSERAASAKAAPNAHEADGGVAVASVAGTVVAAAAPVAKVTATAARAVVAQEGSDLGGPEGSGGSNDGGVRPGDGGVPDAAPSRRARVAVAAGESGGKPTGGGSAPGGGSWVNERSRVAEEDSLTRIDRFVAGGAPLKGRVVAAETGKPLEGATIHAHSGGSYVEASSDAAGAFRVEGMPAKSRAIVWVDTPRGAFISERIEIAIGAEGQAADVGTIRLLRGDELRERAPGWVGLFVSRQGAQLVAGAVSAWLPADKAEVQVGDEILSIEGHDTAGLGPRAATYLLRGTVGDPATIVVRSHGTKRTLTLDRVPR